MDTEATTKAIAANVARLLREAGVSQRDTSTSTGIPLTTLVRRLTGRSPFLVTELSAIAELLGVPLTVLVTTDTPQSVADVTGKNLHNEGERRGNSTEGAA